MCKNCLFRQIFQYNCYFPKIICNFNIYIRYTDRKNSGNSPTSRTDFIDCDRKESIMEFQNAYAGHFTAPEFKEKMARSRGVLLVCGSCEQHGHHLPLDTDTIIGFEIALRIAAKTNLLVLPPIPYGQVWSAKGFPGTFSLSSGTLKLLLRELIMSLEEQQAPNILLMSGHNGNYPFLKELARELLDEFGWNNIWHFPLAFSKETLSLARSQTPMAPHAGELETALMLYLRPELVDLSKATCEFPKPPRDYPYRPIHWKEFVETGSFGDGKAATAEFGKALVEDMVERTAALIRELI